MTCHNFFKLSQLVTTCYNLPQLALACYNLPQLAETYNNLPQLATTACPIWPDHSQLATTTDRWLSLYYNRLNASHFIAADFDNKAGNLLIVWTIFLSPCIGMCCVLCSQGILVILLCWQIVSFKTNGSIPSWSSPEAFCWDPPHGHESLAPAKLTLASHPCIQDWLEGRSPWQSCQTPHRASSPFIQLDSGWALGGGDQRNCI